MWHKNLSINRLWIEWYMEIPKEKVLENLQFWILILSNLQLRLLGTQIFKSLELLSDSFTLFIPHSLALIKCWPVGPNAFRIWIKVCFFWIYCCAFISWMIQCFIFPQDFKLFWRMSSSSVIPADFSAMTADATGNPSTISSNLS